MKYNPETSDKLRQRIRNAAIPATYSSTCMICDERIFLDEYIVKIPLEGSEHWVHLSCALEDLEDKIR